MSNHSVRLSQVEVNKLFELEGVEWIGLATIAYKAVINQRRIRVNNQLENEIILNFSGGKFFLDILFFYNSISERVSEILKEKGKSYQLSFN